MIRCMAVAIAIAIMSPQITAQESEGESEALSPNVLIMTLEDGELLGDGADLILNDLQNAQFVLIGEDHGFADPAQIALALAKVGRPYGLTHHVAEIGRLTDDELTKTLTGGDIDDLAQLLAGRPLAMPFVNLIPDAELADYFIDEAAPFQDSLWGIDQEFIGSPLLHLETLLEMAETAETKSMVRGFLEAEQTAFKTGNQGAVFMFSASPSDFAKLRAAFTDDEAASEIVDALRESAAMYQDFGAGKNFASNTNRVTYMRNEFLDAYANAPGPAPRALFKFGAIHMARGTTFLNTFDLGSLTEGIAAANGLEVLRIAILPLEGNQTIIRPSSDGAFESKEVRSDEMAKLLELVGVDERSIPKEGYAVLEMEPLRRSLEQARLNELPHQTKFFVLGFDYIVTTRGARAAVPVTDR